MFKLNKEISEPAALLPLMCRAAARGQTVPWRYCTAVRRPATFLDVSLTWMTGVSQAKFCLKYFNLHCMSSKNLTFDVIWSTWTSTFEVLPTRPLVQICNIVFWNYLSFCKTYHFYSHLKICVGIFKSDIKWNVEIEFMGTYEVLHRQRRYGILWPSRSPQVKSNGAKWKAMW